MGGAILADMSLKTLLALGAVAITYVLTAFVYLPTGAYWTPDVGIKRIQAENVRFTPWPDFSLEYPGRWLDPELKYVPCALPLCYRVGDRVYADQSPIIAVLARPFLPALGDRGGLIVPVLAGLACVLWVGYVTQHFRLGPAWAGILLAGLASPLWFYSVLLWEHTLGLALGLATVAILLRWPLSPGRAVISGGLAGLAGGARKEMLIFALVAWLWLCVREIRQERRAGLGLGLWLLACGLALVPCWGVGFLSSGQVTPAAFAYGVIPQFTPDAYLLIQGWAGLVDFLFDPRVHGIGIGLVWIASGYAAARWIRSPGPRAAVRSLMLIVFGLGAVVFLINRTPGSGLFGVLNVAPVLLLALESTGEHRASARPISLIAFFFWVLSVLSLGLLTPVGPRQSGLEWGARYTLAIFPMGVPLAVAGLDTLRQSADTGWRRLHYAAALGNVLLSVVIQCAGLFEVQTTVLNRRLTRDALLATPEHQVVYGQFWLPMLSPDVFLRKELFYIPNDDDLRQWASTAYVQGVRAWAYYRYYPLDPARADPLAPPGARLRVVETIPLRDGRFITRLEFISTP